MGVPKSDDSRTELSESSESSGDETSRGNWSGKLDFMMSCISFAVGLGNIWRFPYLCYRNGGGAFLIPYCFFLLLCGMPLFFMEVALGQYPSLSPITIWRICPLFKGLGWGMVIISSIVCVYYNVIITWTLYYLFNSFSKVLPWSTCDNHWNTPSCTIYTSGHTEIGINSSALNVSNSSLSNHTLYNGTLENSTFVLTTPSEEYWQRRVLQLTDGIHDLGGIQWELLAFLTFAWLCVFLCLIKGVKSSGKVVYFTATYPYLVLLCLFLRGITLPGSVDGLKFFLIPEWEKLLHLKVWGEAAMQIFFSLGPAWGALITMASYNKFNNDCLRDALIVPIVNGATSIFAGFAIFSIIGFMAFETGKTIENVVTHGPGLVFVVYPEAISRLPFSQVWAVMFFAMLFSLGIGSQLAMFQTATSGFIDEFDILKTRKVLVTGVLCVIELLAGIFCVTRGGIYVLTLMDWYSATFSLMIISLFECIIIMYIYGVDRFYKDITVMIGYRPHQYWKIVWCYITPVIIFFVLLFSFVIHTPVKYGDYEYPNHIIFIGWMLAISSIIPVPVVAIYKIYKCDLPIIEAIKHLTKPDEKWGPAAENYRDFLKGGQDQVLNPMPDKMLSSQENEKSAEKSYLRV